MHCVNVDMRMHAQMKNCKKEKKSPYQYFFTTLKMPLVISCRFLGKGNYYRCAHMCEIHTDERTK